MTSRCSASWLPLVVVRRKSDGQKGSLMFQAHPRFYFGFEPHRP